MLVCMTDDEECADEMESPKKKDKEKKDKDKKYLWNHGSKCENNLNIVHFQNYNYSI